MKANKTSVEQSAQALIDATDPETLRQFFETYPVESPSPTEAIAPARTPRPIRFIDPREYTLTRTNEELAAEVDFHALADSSARALSNALTTAEAKTMATQLKAHFDSADFQNWFAAQIKDEPFTGLAQQFATLSQRIRAHAISYDHLVSFDELHTALLRNTLVSIVLPKTLFPKKLVHARKNPVQLNITQPLTMRRKKMIANLIDFLLDYAAVAQEVHSESVRDWKAAYRLTLQTVGGPWAKAERIAKPFPKKMADLIIDLISVAYYDLFADISVSDHLQQMQEVK